MLSDFILLALSFLLGLYFRFNGNIPWELNKEWFRFIVLFIGIKLIIYYLAQLYHILWKFAGMRDLWRIIIANVAASVLVFGLNRFLVTGIPRSILSIIFILDTFYWRISTVIPYDKRCKESLQRTHSPYDDYRCRRSGQYGGGRTATASKLRDVSGFVCG